jgi:putative ABC transport system permease protein
MNLDLRPIVSSLLRNRAAAMLIIFQVAIALAVFANATWIVHQRFETLNEPSGLDDQNIFVISSAAFTEHFDYESSLQADLAYLRALPGVVAAAPSDGLPFSQVGFTIDLWTNSNQAGAPERLNALSMDAEGMHALGISLHSGRVFRADEIEAPPTADSLTDFVPEVLITQSAADALYPHQNPLGKTVYDPTGKPAAIIGILDDFTGSVPSGLATAKHVALFPRLPPVNDLKYVIRTEPGRRDQLLVTAAAHLAESNPDRVIKYARTLSQYERRLHLADRNMEIFLSCAVGLVLITTCLGIYGLVTFNVSTRTRQIGTRRALGARRRDILRYFMVESGLLTAAGVLIGSGLAIGGGAWLTRQYGLPRLNQ